MFHVGCPRLRFRLGLSLIFFSGCIASLTTTATAIENPSDLRVDIRHPSARQASRFLEHATWGPTVSLIERTGSRLRAVFGRTVRGARVQLSDLATVSNHRSCGLSS